MKQDSYSVLGIMSGTSLDGLDLALCRFKKEAGQWLYDVVKCSTIEYTEGIRGKLASVSERSALDFVKLDLEFGNLIADSVNKFLVGESLKPDFIASHGHTIFHQPGKEITSQIGSGAVIAVKTGIDTICDFRTMDVANGGQGAPLVPIGDELLFGRYDACLNLGGIANISFKRNGKRVAFDISVCNMALNYVSQSAGFEYDRDGKLARSGKLKMNLLEQLNSLSYYEQTGAKSLGREWFNSFILPCLQKEISTADTLRTLCEHIVYQITKVLDAVSGETVLVTGGGAKNSYLIERLTNSCGKKIIIPQQEIVDFKEALIFGFLGVLRARNEINCLKEVTGTKSDLVTGALYLGKNHKKTN